MITSTGKLEIFENSRVDDTLPKWKHTRRSTSALTRGISSEGSSVAISSSLGESDLSSEEDMEKAEPALGTFTMSPDFVIRTVNYEGPPSWWGRIKRLFRRNPPRSDLQYSIPEFFRELKNSAEELQVVDSRAQGYEAALVSAREAGQKALEEKLLAGLQVFRAESQLVAMGFRTFLTEETVVQFTQKTHKGVRLDLLRNFTRLLPPACLEDKRRLDQNRVFDNYAVLHFDPDTKSYQKTQEELREAKKDPILFGLLRGSRKLYFVGEWVDEFCDLTLDQIAETLGSDPKKDLRNEPIR